MRRHLFLLCSCVLVSIVLLGGARVTFCLEPALQVPQPGSGNVVLPIFQKPFMGDRPLTNFFDHNLPFQFDTTPGIANEFQLTWWGERTFGIDGHSGYDWLMPEGTPLLAVADGVVVFAGELAPAFCPILNATTAGVLIQIDHSELIGGQPAIRSRYNHMSRIDVAVGQHVKAGDQIGLSGNVGCSTAPHLHFVASRFVPATGRFSLIDPYGWEGSGADPWAQHPEGAESLWLWKDGEAPAVTYREGHLAPNPNGSTAPVTLTTFRHTGWRDEDHPNNEFVEVTLDNRFAVSGTADLTGFKLRNNRGDTFNFPSGFILHDGAPVKVFSGSGTNSGTELFWGQNRGIWDDMGDCARLVYPGGGNYFLTSRGTCGVAPTNDVGVAVSTSASGTVGQPLVYTASVTSNGAVDATGVVLTADLPDGLTAASFSVSQGGCFGTTTVFCNIGTLASGAGASASISVVPNVATTVVSDFALGANQTDPNPADNAASVATTILGPLTVSGSSLPNAEVGVEYNTSLGLSGGVAPYIISVIKGALPAGLGITFANITGTPAQAKNASFTIKVTDQAGASVTKSFKITTLKPLVIATANLKTAKVGKNYSAAIKSSGGARPYSWSLVSGDVPPGLAFDISSGSITGIPTAAGSSAFTLRLSDPVGGAVQREFTISVS